MSDSDPATDRTEELLSDVLLLPPHQREAALDAICDAHPDVADELRSRYASLAALGLDLVTTDSKDTEFMTPERLGEFELIAPLGGGGMGIVYLAHQPSLGRDVALKVIRPEGLFFADTRERFRREVEAIARLEHPGIIKVHAVGDEGGVPYFAMERIDGSTLAEVLKRLADRAPGSLKGRDLRAAVHAPEDVDSPLFEMSWPDACAEIARRVADALQHAHDQGVVHRDVKPSNVAITRDGRVQLFDFGLAGSDEVDRLTRSGGQLGTLRYMAPELLRGDRELDARADVYALGTTLYEMLSLRAPFEGDSRLAIESNVLDGRPVPLRAINRRVSPELERVTAKAMDLDRTRRYPTAAELASDLRRVLERRPVSAKAPGPMLRARRWAQRNPASAVGLVAAVLMFAVVPSVLLWRETVHSSELAESLRKESEALAAETVARKEAETSFRFVEGILFATDPYASNDPDATLRDLLAYGARGLDEIPGLEDSPTLEGRLALGLAYGCWSRSLFDEALTLGRRALEIEQRTGTPLRVNDVRPIQVVTESLSGMGRFAEAEAILAQAVEADDGSDSYYRGRLLFLLGTAQLNQNKTTPAEEHLLAALAIFTPAEGENAEPNTAIRWRLSGVLCAQGRYAEALDLAEPTIDAARAMTSDDHPSVAEGLTCCAAALAGLGEMDAAIDAQREATEIIDDFYGVESFPGVRFHGDLALLLRDAKRYDEALEEVELTVAISDAVLGESDSRTISARRHLKGIRALAEGDG